MRLTLAAVLLAAASAAFAQAEPGDLWDVTTSMEMPGMKLPTQSQRVCVPRGAEGPDAMGAGDARCTMSDVKRSPGKFSFRVQCPDGSGTGEMNYQGKDRYTSRMTMTADGQTMTMVSSGARVGDCDASTVKKQVAAIEAQAAAGMAQMCGSAVETLLPANLTAYQCEPRYKTDLCARAGTKAGFQTVASRQPAGNPVLDSGTLPEVAKFCGIDADATRTRLCTEAGKAEDLDFIGAQCPALAAPIAQRECAGRSFSSPPAEKYRSFCSEYARELMQGGAPGAQPPTPTDAIKEGAKRLKGLFGR